jgi:hypothetical protein
MQNESDALHILALASGQAVRDDDDHQTQDSAQRSRSQSKVMDTMGQISPRQTSRKREPKHLTQFALIKLGILSADQVVSLADKFFKFHHHLFVSSGYGVPSWPSQWYLRLSSPGHWSNWLYSPATSDTCSRPS